MNVARLYGMRDIRIETTPKPALRPGQALVRVKRVGICGSDRHFYLHGGIGDDKLTHPLILGHEVAGVVEAVGEGSINLKPGTRVAVDPAQPCGQCEYCLSGHPNLCENLRFLGAWPTDGGLQEWLAYPTEWLVPLLEGVSLEEGVLLETLGVALHAVRLGKIQVGETVGILGAGPVGLLILQVAQLCGTKQIFVSDRLPERLKMAQHLGADEVFQASRTMDVSQEILKQTNGRGVDVVFEAADAGDTIQQAVEIARPGGRIIVVGISPRDPIVVPSNLARRKGLTMKFSRRMQRTYPLALELLLKGRVHLAEMVTHHFPLPKIQTAFETVAEYRDGVLKAIVDL